MFKLIELILRLSMGKSVLTFLNTVEQLKN